MKKSIWISLIFISPFGLIGILALWVYLTLNSPTLFKFSLEKGLSQFTHAPVSIGDVELIDSPYGFKLNHLRLNLDSGKKSKQQFEIREATLFLSLSGSFGNRVLWIDRFELDTFKLLLNSPAKLPDFEPSSSPNFFSNVATNIFSRLAFKKVRLKAFSIKNGTVEQYDDQRQISFSNINLDVENESTLTGSFIASIFDRNHEIESPNIFIDVNANYHQFKDLAKLEGGVLFSADQICVGGLMLSDLATQTDFQFDPKKKQLSLYDFQLSSKINTFFDSSKTIYPFQISLNLNGMVDLKNEKVEKARWQLLAGKMGELNGSITGRWKKSLQAKLALEESWLNFEQITSVYPVLASDQLRQFEFKEKVNLNGNISLFPDNAKHRLGLELIFGLNQNPYSFKREDLLLQGEISGHFALKGSWPGNLTLGGKLNSHLIELKHSSICLDSTKVEFGFLLRYPDLLLEDINGQIDLVTLPHSDKPLQLKDLKISANGARWNLNSLNGSLPAIHLDSNLFKNIILAVNHTPLTTAVSISADDSGLLDGLKKLEFLSQAIQIQAFEAFQADVVFDQAEKRIKWQIGLNLKKVSFENQDQSVLAEKVNLFLTAHGKLLLEDSTLLGRIRLNCNAGEILWDRFYMDFKQYPLHLAGGINTVLGQRRMNVNDGILKLDGLAAVEFEAKNYQAESATGWNLEISVPLTAIEPIYNLAVKEPYELEKPFLSSLTLAGMLDGKLGVIIDSNHWEFKGRVGWRDGSLALSEKNLSLEGIHWDIPFWFASESKEAKKAPLKGSFSIGNMKLPLLAQQAVSLPLVVTENELSIPKGASLRAKGSGSINIGPLKIALSDKSDLELDTRIDINQWEFDAGLSQWWPSYGPILINATFDPVRIRSGNLLSKGSLITELFEGTLTISDPSILAVFGNTPVLDMDVAIENWDLAALTDQTGFGKIEGVLKGKLDDLQIVNGQPQQFFLHLETVRKKGVAQKISVEAVDSIAKIGGGRSPFIGLAGKFAAWFKKFGYRKIGVAASLKNDMFKVNGLVREKGQEYLIKKSGLSGVDVVNSNPNNLIGFKDMTKRIRRVFNSERQPVVQ